MGGPLYVAAFAVGSTLLLLVLAMLGRRRLARDLASGNDAQRFAAAGEVLGVFLIAGATVKDGVQGQSVARDAIACSSFGVVALAASILVGRLGVRMLLGGVLQKELERGNVASGLAAMSQLLATALVTSRAIAGSEPRTIGVSLAFFALAQATLLVFVTLFRALTTYDDADQIHGENFAAALSYAGATGAIAIAVSHALEGDFEGWTASLRGYGGVLLSLLALWPVRQLFLQTILLRAPLRARGGVLDAAIAERRSTGMAALEAASYLATALAITQVA
jgi:uncharacterized membrane protein YjfL (UPF0719 family)